jgi:Tfp pilus assembly protein PilF
MISRRVDISKLVLGSGNAASQDYALAVAIEQRLGDRDAERSIAAQWKRTIPGIPAVASLFAYRNQ